MQESITFLSSRKRFPHSGITFSQRSVEIFYTYNLLVVRCAYVGVRDLQPGLVGRLLETLWTKPWIDGWIDGKPSGEIRG